METERKPGTKMSVEIADGVEMQFCWIPPGKLDAGFYLEFDPKDGGDKLIDFASGFWMSKSRVTCTQWEAIMAEVPPEVDLMNFPNRGAEVYWGEAKEFIAKMNSRDTTYTFALPSETAWVYAVCAGYYTYQPVEELNRGDLYFLVDVCHSRDLNMYNHGMEWMEDIFHLRRDHFPRDGSPCAGESDFPGGKGTSRTRRGCDSYPGCNYSLVSKIRWWAVENERKNCFRVVAREK